MEPADLADARADADLLAGRMRRTAERATDALATAAARIYEIRSPGGEVTVSVDGRPRVTAIRVDPRAMRLDPETLGGILTRTVDEAQRHRGAHRRAHPRQPHARRVRHRGDQRRARRGGRATSPAGRR